MSIKLLTVGEVAKMFHVNVKTVENWVRKKSVKDYEYVRTPGGHLRFHEKYILERLAKEGK